ncbi:MULTISPECIES: hypothetical protein [unclassified Oceanobacillus]|uniref:hypothetical protein n=1 Tax=unclassified Oceanobacillus TaxID=2630292 RepID=UPI00300E2DA7
MQSKLDKLMENDDFGKGASDYDAGIMIYENDSLNFILFSYEHHFEVYLSLFDEEPPHIRDYLIYAKADTLEEAQRQAEEQLIEILDNSAH